MAKKKLNIDIRKHVLVPKHAKLSEADKKKLLELYRISVFDLPIIKKNDRALSELDVKAGDIIKIVRASPTAGEAIFYRCVVNG